MPHYTPLQIVAVQGYGYPGQPPHLWKYYGINLTQEECMNQVPTLQPQAPSLKIYTAKDGASQLVIMSL